MTYKDILQQYWGYENFRGIQQNIIESIGEGKDTLAKRKEEKGTQDGYAQA